MVQFTRLRLSGFKSFVEPTELDIGSGLTGIVGPNGCGKSNLVEALRWAMGENSPKRMRSSGMDDVIFNGTEKRPARNTAEVVLFLDNSDRTAPAEINDSDDLEVSRKIERETGSTYRVNGKAVRMRDVQLLFADSSIGAHSPAMVSQGRVADMINAKPAQRRMVLEEAAGVSGLHARRHEAELKLRVAEQNLTRVEDAIGAMNTQLEALKKQARQANRYRNLSGHITTAEGSLLYLRWLHSSAATQEATAAFQVAEDLVRDKMLAVTELTTRQTEAAADIPELRSDEAEAAAILQRLKLAFGGLESEERQVRDERAKAETLLRQFTADVAHENAQQAEAVEKMTLLSAEQADIESAMKNHATREEEARIIYEERQAIVEKRETELADLTEEAAMQDANRAAVERRVGEFSRRLEQLQSRKSALETQHADTLANTPAQAQLDDLSLRIPEAEESYQAALLSFDLAESARGDSDKAALAASESLQDAQKTHDGLTAEINALRRILKNPHEGYQPVLDQLTVEGGLERALAVALGDDLQATLDGAAPIFWRDLPDMTPPPALPSGARPLLQYAQGPHALSRALSHVGVVDNAETAERLMFDLLPGQCLVTSDGGAWRWDGLVVSSTAENAAAIRLQQKNRLSDLESAAEKALEILDAARAASSLAKTQRDESIQAVNVARSRFKQSEETLNGLRKQQAKLAHQLTEVTSFLSRLAASIESAVQEISEATTQLDESREGLKTLPDTTETRTRIATLKLELGENRQALANERAAHAEIRHVGESRTRRLRQIAEETQSWRGRIERVDLRLTEMQERIAQAKETLERLEGRPAEIEGEKQNLLTHIGEAEKKRQDAADILTESENVANALQRELRATESSLSDAREARAMALAAVSTTQHTQNGIEAQIQEKFACLPEALPTKSDFKPDELPSIESLQEKVDRLLRERENMGPVNLLAEAEAQEITDKTSAIAAERDDLTAAIGKLREGINKLNREARERLLLAFDAVNGHFQTLFVRLFNGGQAHLKLIEADDPLEAGLEIYAQPPGKKLQVLSLLSGGEQTLASIALIFAMFLTNPAPICVLDEVDAPLDESNVDRYCTLLEDLAKEDKTRFIVITHHRMTMARMDRLYGVTMSERGVSQLVSVDLRQPELQLEHAA